MMCYSESTGLFQCEDSLTVLCAEKTASDLLEMTCGPVGTHLRSRIAPQSVKWCGDLLI